MAIIYVVILFRQKFEADQPKKGIDTEHTVTVQDATVQAVEHASVEVEPVEVEPVEVEPVEVEPVEVATEAHVDAENNSDVVSLSR